MQETSTQTAPEKVTYMVGAFLSEDSDSLQVSTTKAESEKVTIMVGTFLNCDRNYLQTIKVATKPAGSSGVYQ